MTSLAQTLGRVLTPLVTPFTADGELDYQTLGDLAQMVIERDFADSLIVSGTTGEFYVQSLEERIQTFQVVKEAVGGRVPLIAGVGAAYVGNAIKLVREAEALKFDACMVVAPYYCKPTQKGIYEHMRLVGENTDLPVMIYNIPLFTGVNIEPDTLAALARIKNIRAVKEEAGVNPIQSSDYAMVVPDDFAIYCGDDVMVLQVLSQGGVGVVSGGSQVIGDRIKKMIDDYLNGNIEAAVRAHLSAFRFYRALGQNERINPTPLLKDAISMTWRSVGPPRLPLLPGTEEEQVVLKQTLIELDVAVRETDPD